MLVSTFFHSSAPVGASKQKKMLRESATAAWGWAERCQRSYALRLPFHCFFLPQSIYFSVRQCCYFLLLLCYMGSPPQFFFFFSSYVCVRCSCSLLFFVPSHTQKGRGVAFHETKKFLCCQGKPKEKKRATGMFCQNLYEIVPT